MTTVADLWQGATTAWLGLGPDAQVFAAGGLGALASGAVHSVAAVIGKLRDPPAGRAALTALNAAAALGVLHLLVLAPDRMRAAFSALQIAEADFFACILGYAAVGLVLAGMRIAAGGGPRSAVPVRRPDSEQPFVYRPPPFADGVAGRGGLGRMPQDERR